MTWNDFNVGDGNFKGKLLKNCMEVCRLALIERCRAADVVLPGILSNTVSKYVVNKQWFSAFQQTINKLLPKFIDKTNNGGSWHMVAYQAPSWTTASIEVFLGEPRKSVSSLISASWFSQQFKILNGMVWRKFPAWSSSEGDKCSVISKKTKYHYVVRKESEHVSLKEAYPQYVEYWNSLPETYSDWPSGGPNATSYYKANYFYNQAGWRSCEFHTYRSGIRFYFNEVYPHRVSVDTYGWIAPAFEFPDDPKKGFCAFEQTVFTTPNRYYLLSSGDFDLSNPGRKYFPQMINPYTSLPKIPTRTEEWQGGWTIDNDAHITYFVAKFDGDGGFNFK